MQHKEANIEIQRNNGKLSCVTVFIPVWHKQEDSGAIGIGIPLFGLKTFAKNENDIDIAIEECLKSFCILSEKFGQGLEKELEVLGWQREKQSTDLNFSVENPVFEQMMETGEPFVHQLEIAC